MSKILKFSAMDVKQSVESIIDKLSASGDVKKIYGEPIEKNGKTIIPVASICYGVVGGGGNNNHQEDEAGGEGAVGGVRAKPLGVIEITEEGTRFIRVDQVQLLIGVFLMAWTLKGILKLILKKV